MLLESSSEASIGLPDVDLFTRASTVLGEYLRIHLCCFSMASRFLVSS